VLTCMNRPVKTDLEKTNTTTTNVTNFQHDPLTDCVPPTSIQKAGPAAGSVTRGMGGMAAGGPESPNNVTSTFLKDHRFEHGDPNLLLPRTHLSLSAAV